MTSYPDTIDNLKVEINKVLKTPPVKAVMFYDLDNRRFDVPAVFVELVDATDNDLQVIQPDRTGIDIEYKITVFSTNAESSSSVSNSQKMVNDIRHRLQREKKNNRRFSGYALDLACVKTEYGSLSLDAYGNRLNFSGGQITLIVRVIVTDETD